ncbi:hypothetical protein NDU88_010796 [Pleurodeles waltl]|uniref:Uncharacterized protein n=1 Tax=Pleurodeles waltl TaxID=8319 RepID=A0AAV7S266_PLEWA|nr:hypothetical protein NDU88_010796 [Pleurodeles waltl]
MKCAFVRPFLAAPTDTNGRTVWCSQLQNLSGPEEFQGSELTFRAASRPARRTLDFRITAERPDWHGGRTAPGRTGRLRCVFGRIDARTHMLLTYMYGAHLCRTARLKNLEKM